MLGMQDPRDYYIILNESRINVLFGSYISCIAGRCHFNNLNIVLFVTVSGLVKAISDELIAIIFKSVPTLNF